MSFLDKYHVDSMLATGETNTFRAQEAATGRRVVVHEFISSQPALQQPDLMSMIYTYLPGEGTPGTEHFLDSGQEDDRIFIVTSDVPECQSLRGWLQFIADSRGGAAAPGPLASAPGPSPAAYGSSPAPSRQPSVTAGTNGPGEFTGMFGAPQSPAPSTATSGRIDDVLLAAPAASASSPEARKKTPGTFTSMFLAPTATTPNPPSPPTVEVKQEPPAKPVDRRPRGQVPNGFQVVAQSRKPNLNGSSANLMNAPTGVMPAPKAPPAELALENYVPTVVVPAPEPTRAAPAPGKPSTPGTFTQMFAAMKDEQAAQRTPPSSPALPKQPSQAPAAVEENTGTFTQMFQPIGDTGVKRPATPPPTGTRAPSPPSRQPPAQMDEPGEFTRMFSSPHATVNPQAAKPASPGVRQPPVRPAAPAAQDEPGEFTAMFQSPAPTGSKAVPPNAGRIQPPAGPASRGSSQAPPSFPASSGESSGPGEFTGLFSTGGAPVTPTGSPLSGSPAPPSVPLSSSSKKGPGELTLLMQGYKSPAAPPAAPTTLDTPRQAAPPPVADPNKREPGEFTMLFRPPNQQPTAAVMPVAPPPPPPVQAAPPPPRVQAPGEYTSVFEAPRFPVTPPQPAPQAPPPPGYAYPGVQVTAPAPPQVPTAPQIAYQPPQAPQFQGPQAPMAPQVSYQPPQTPQFQAPPVYPPPAPQMQPVAIPPPQPAPPTGKKPMIFWVMLMALGCLFLIAVILVIIFAMKH